MARIMASIYWGTDLSIYFRLATIDDGFSGVCADTCPKPHRRATRALLTSALETPKMKTRHLLLALATSALLVAASSLTAACAQTPSAESAVREPAVADPVNHEAVAALGQDMRKLWTDHVVWTRVYVMEAVGNQPGTAAAAARLMKNQEDIGDAIGTYYGAAADDQLTALLKDHISVAVEIVKTAKAGDKTGQAAAETRWQQNADEIATFLSGANPNWPKATMADFLTEHLSTTKDEVVARLGKKWDDDVQAFDRVYHHMLEMSDAISAGIVKQFPEKFR
jgi:hypothetical protein